MMRPNWAMDAPPEALSIAGREVPVQTDYRVWLQALDLIKPPLTSARLRRLERLLFGAELPDDPTEVLGAIAEFMRGYPSAPMREVGEGAQAISLHWDLNELLLAIRNQSGLDLSYRRKEPFHWWLFLLEMKTLCGDHYILELADARGYAGSDPARLALRERVALPVADQEANEALNRALREEFWNA
ncbi:MAG: hypothetical protein IJ234_08510 [Clostridia bacterium]|nr:hypothetical protein [Clostridia bacterium]